ncbi:hypothetical protein [Amnibacterium sp.]|uniref:hypothetical protein n=1 Tax=Amnibacterium sp. TaxID=1872496 RepID=UPI0026090A5A|nr:hypothetical protein [Amnibacterium sp.]
MPAPAAVLIGSVVAVMGLLFMWFRVPLATFFRETRERYGRANAASQTPGLVFVVGAGFFLVGSFIAVGTLAGWVHPK